MVDEGTAAQPSTRKRKRSSSRPSVPTASSDNILDLTVDEADEIKGAMKFKEQGLQNEDKLAKMFDDLMNTGEDHWNPSSGVAPSHGIAGEESTNNGGDEDEGDNEEDDDSEPEEVTPASAKGKKHAGKDTNKGKKPKTSGG
ncbi:hypothetical protein PR202_gb28568 [Eleusine coracana subsp. coracana]|uniref:Uncharacterized protein n=1 Tax=Eleusine coracana subsp. coracana TaxID=191504 RepID=A0AAV5FXU9_ELECO|nr:hypothetical protein PR202_gb28568 [Eleusine coracana subsp. coracana]